MLASGDGHNEDLLWK